jgi:hypothetical protein
MGNFNDAIYALEMRKRYWQEKLRVAKAQDESTIMQIFQEKINEIDLAIEKLR